MLPNTVNVLLVEDDEDDYLITRDLLERTEEITATLDWFDAFERAAAAINNGDHDVYLVDYRIGPHSGLDLIEEVLGADPAAACVLLTGQGDRELETRAMQLGAADYLRKDSLDTETLERSIRHALARKRVLSQLLETRRRELEMRDEFLSHVSHELRTPITVIHQFATIIQDGLAGATTSEQDEYLAIMVCNLNRLTEMVTELVEVTRVEAGKLTVERGKVSVAPLLEHAEDSFKPIAAEAGLQLTFEPVEEGLEVLADPERFHQVLSNLVLNAVKFTPAGGSITVTASRENDAVRFDVADTGKGIPAEMCDRIFERLVQVPEATDASRKGLGLGLYIVQQLVHLQDGKVWVTSMEGAGSTFSFTMPTWSLPKILLPVVERSLDRGVPFLLMSVRPWDGDDLQSVGDERMQVAAALQHFAFPMDVVIPPMMPADRRETTYIAAAAAEANAPVIVQRIKDALATIDLSPGRILQPDVAHVMTHTQPDSTEDVSDLLRQVAQRVEEQITIDNESP